MLEQSYAGQELDIFAKAVNWKKYFSSIITPYIGKKVVEVGAGIGATTAFLCDGTQEEWVCLEPDSVLRKQVDEKIADGQLPACCHTQEGFISNLEGGKTFDTILYIDVLEHIEEDRKEIEAASARLTIGGTIIVLSPAFRFLYSEFDRSIGHIRRYQRGGLIALTPEICQVKKIVSLDSIGLFTSLMNKTLLRQPLPTTDQILFWDNILIPVSRLVDKILDYRVGRSIICIWKRKSYA